MGVRCKHPEHRIDAILPIPLILAIPICQKYKAREADKKSKQSAKNGMRHG